MWVIFALLDTDPDPDSEYESTDLIESGSNPDPDPKPCSRQAFLHYIILYSKASTTYMDTASCCRGNSEKASELYEACIKAATQEDLAGDLTIKAGTRSFHSSFPNRESLVGSGL